jgi:cysteine desulfurase family protein
MASGPDDQPRRRYFDNAATSFPKPPAVAEAMLRFMTGNGAPGRGAYSEARAAARLIRRARERIARLVNLSSPEHVVFGHNTSDSLNLAVKGALTHVRRARNNAPLHVVTTVMEHNSILRPLNALRQEWGGGESDGLEITFVHADPGSGFVDPAHVAGAIRPGRTALICINHASNVTGAVQDLDAIGAACAKFGTGSADLDAPLLLVDGAQSLGHVPVDMQRMHIDLLAFPGHKGLLGPTGTGGLCIRPGVEHRLDTIREGGTGSSSEEQTQPAMMPEKYEAGSHNTVGIVGLSEGVAWILERGVDSIREHEIQLMERMLEALAPRPDGRCRNAPGLRLLGPLDTSRRVGVFSFVHDDLSAQEMAAALESSFGILTRAGLHCAPLVHEMLGTSPTTTDSARSGAVRLSVGPFLQAHDVAYACEALASVCRGIAPRSRLASSPLGD